MMFSRVIEESGILEPEDRRDDDPALILGEHAPQGVPGTRDAQPGQSGRLKLAYCLLDEVDAVEHDHDRRAADRWVIEQAQARRMP